MRGGSLLKNLAQRASNTKKNRGSVAVDDLVMPEDVEQGYRNTVQNHVDPNYFSSINTSILQQGKLNSGGKLATPPKFSSNSSTDSASGGRLTSGSSIHESEPFSSADHHAGPVRRIPAMSNLAAPVPLSVGSRKRSESMLLIPPAGPTAPPAPPVPPVPPAPAPRKLPPVPIIPPAVKRADSTGEVRKEEAKKEEDVKKEAEAKEDEEQQKLNQLVNDSDELLTKFGEPLRRRLNVELPLEKFAAAAMQAGVCLRLMEARVRTTATSVEEVNRTLVDLSQGVRSISEKSMDVTQTAEAVISKVSVLDDWIDGLENAGSGIKIQLIEWAVRFVSLISALFVFIWRTVQKINPFRRQSAKYLIAEEGEGEEEDE